MGKEKDDGKVQLSVQQQEKQDSDAFGVYGRLPKAKETVDELRKAFKNRKKTPESRAIRSALLPKSQGQNLVH